jgi:hypothetical protein
VIFLVSFLLSFVLQITGRFPVSDGTVGNLISSKAIKDSLADLVIVKKFFEISN